MSRRPNRLPDYTLTDGDEIEGDLQVIDLDNSGQNLPAINIKSSPAVATAGTIVQLEADGSNWSAGSIVMKLISDDSSVNCLVISDGSSNNFLVDRSGNFIANGNMTLGGGGTVTTTSNGDILLLPNGTGITKVGDAGATSHSLAANDDLFVAGKLEVNGTAYMDGNLICTNLVTANDNVQILFGSGGDAGIMWGSAQTPDSWLLGTGTDSNALILCERADITFDFAHAQATNPTFFIHSANQATDEWIGLTHDQTDGVISIGSGKLKVPSYTRHYDINASSATLGPTAPALESNDTFRGLAFNADAEEVFFNVEIPSEWDGVSDMSLRVVWMPTGGDAVANTETVKWDATYRSIAFGEAVNTGTAVSVTSTFTGGVSETDKELYVTTLTIDFNNGNQPLTAGDVISFQFSRDVTGDNYSGNGIVLRWELAYAANALGTH